MSIHHVQGEQMLIAGEASLRGFASRLYYCPGVEIRVIPQKCSQYQGDHFPRIMAIAELGHWVNGQVGEEMGLNTRL